MNIGFQGRFPDGFPGGFSTSSHGHPCSHASPQRQERFDVLPVGTRICVHSLVSTPELNGIEGEVEGFDASRGRYQVRLNGKEDVKAMKFENLTQKLKGVEVIGLNSCPEVIRVESRDGSGGWPFETLLFVPPVLRSSMRPPGSLRSKFALPSAPWPLFVP